MGDSKDVVSLKIFLVNVLSVLVDVGVNILIKVPVELCWLPKLLQFEESGRLVRHHWLRLRNQRKFNAQVLHFSRLVDDQPRFLPHNVVIFERIDAIEVGFH
jgi:hypothetical protein